MADQDYENSPAEDNSPEDQTDFIMKKAGLAAEAIGSVLRMLADPIAIEIVLADIVGEHLASYCEHHRAAVRKELIEDIDRWTEQYSVEVEDGEEAEQEPRKLDS